MFKTRSPFISDLCEAITPELKNRLIVFRFTSMRMNGMVISPGDQPVYECLDFKWNAVDTTPSYEGVFEINKTEQFNMVLYCVDNVVSERWAIVVHCPAGNFEIYNSKDEMMTEADFKSQYNYSASMVIYDAIRMLKYKIYQLMPKRPRKELTNTMKFYQGGRNERIEELLLMMPVSCHLIKYYEGLTPEEFAELDKKLQTEIQVELTGDIGLLNNESI